MAWQIHNTYTFVCSLYCLARPWALFSHFFFLLVKTKSDTNYNASFIRAAGCKEDLCTRKLSTNSGVSQDCRKSANIFNAFGSSTSKPRRGHRPYYILISRPAQHQHSQSERFIQIYSYTTTTYKVNRSTIIDTTISKTIQQLARKSYWVTPHPNRITIIEYSSSIEQYN